MSADVTVTRKLLVSGHIGNAFPMSYENLLLGSHIDDLHSFDRCRQSSSSSSLKCQGQLQCCITLFSLYYL